MRSTICARNIPKTPDRRFRHENAFFEGKSRNMLDQLPGGPTSTRRYYPSLLFAPDRAARVRIALTYGLRHRRFVHPHRPRRFTDWIQWRKLYDRDPRMPAFADKVAVKRHVADTLGEPG